MPDPTAKGEFDDLVDLVTKPSQGPSGSASSFIHVYYTEAVMYSLPVDQCRSWFVSIAAAYFNQLSELCGLLTAILQAFISHFHDFWPSTLKFTHRDRLVTAADWPTIFNLARLSSSRVLLVLKRG